MADEKEDKEPRDLRQEVTDKMIEVLDKGEIPWNKPWESFENGLPRNMATGARIQWGQQSDVDDGRGRIAPPSWMGQFYWPQVGQFTWPLTGAH